jgi:SAM-dependent methyltransferase
MTEGIIPSERIHKAIYLIRGQKILLDRDLAALYEVPTKVLKQAVKRNIERFPEDFMFVLTREELMNWRSQVVTSNSDKMGLRHAPMAFTEQGVAMLSGVLNSPRAIHVNIAIMRAFVHLRLLLATHADLARKLEELEKKYDSQFRIVFDAIRQLTTLPEPPDTESERAISRMSDWSDDDSLWEAMEPALCAPSRLALAEGDVAAILAAVDLPPQAKVLDLGCGPGAHAIAMGGRGHRVTGVDRSRRLLDRARLDAKKRGIAVEWVEADMRNFRRPSFFDLVCSLYTSFGYFDDRGNRMVLENILASLKPGGAAFLDLIGRETTARQWQEHRQIEVEGVLYDERRRIADDWSALISDWVVIRGGTRKSFRVKQRLYAGTEIRDLLLSVGFAKVALRGSLDAKAPYDESATRLVAVALAPAGNSYMTIH